MSQVPFSKPPPVEPPPAEGWLDLTDRAEVGREPFFSGRDAEYDVFRRAINSLRLGHIGGGTMIFQGAPGAGKSALMLECMEAVRRHSTPEDPWVAVSPNPGTLRSPVNIVTSLIRAANRETERLSKITSTTKTLKFNELRKLGIKLYREFYERGVGIGGISVGGKLEGDSHFDSSISAETAFSGAAPLLENLHLVVFVDEAQNTPVESSTREVLDCLHRDSYGIPLVAAFFGLSDTQEVLRQCGLSRFADQRVVNLEPLSLIDATASLKRMLDAYYVGPEAEKDYWASSLAELSQGWPQHVNRVGVAAGRVLRCNQGQLERHLLEKALEKGTERKNDYYAERLAACSQDPELYKHLAEAAVDHPDGALPRKQLRHLAESSLNDSGESFNDFLSNALHAGLLAPVKNLPYHYQFPIPSLGDYLRNLPV